jgi:hypothetical protein
VDDEPPLNRDISQQLNNNLTGIITNAMTTTLAETPCKLKFYLKKPKHSISHLCFFLAIHKMTERTLAASPNMDGSERQRSSTTNETSRSSTRVLDKT